MSRIPLQDLYTKHVHLCDEMIQGEDFQGNLFTALDGIHPIMQSVIAELGAGTGRITLQLDPYSRAIHAFDLTPAMLARAYQKIKMFKQRNWFLGVADSRNLHLPSAFADIAVEGWSIAQIMAWHMDTWQTEVDQVLDEMMRIVRPGGTVVVIENLGTGETTPCPPERFIPLYEHFEQKWGRSMTWIRTDLRFPSGLDALRTSGAVFGEVIIERGMDGPDVFVIPECTGIWWRTVATPQKGNSCVP